MPERRPPPPEAPDYSVPALEKALDIVELLASRKEGLTQQQIAAEVGRSASQIFRTLLVLESRGYVHRERPAGLYFLSMRLFELAHQHAPTRGLIQVALPAMRDFADRLNQSCNLGVVDQGWVVILAEAESPAPFGFRVRVGARFALLGAATGRCLLAFQEAERRDAWLALSDAVEMTEKERKALLARLPGVAQRGYEETADALHPGVTDLAFPILDRDGHAVAALTVPYVATTYSEKTLAATRAAGRETAAAITAALRGDAG